VDQKVEELSFASYIRGDRRAQEKIESETE